MWLALTPMAAAKLAPRNSRAAARLFDDSAGRSFGHR